MILFSLGIRPGPEVEIPGLASEPQTRADRVSRESWHSLSYTLGQLVYVLGLQARTIRKVPGEICMSQSLILGK